MYREKPCILRLLILGFLCLPATLQATLPSRPTGELDVLVEHWLQAEGLPQTSAWTITSDTEGYLWVGTEEGLARFDGQRFKVFDASNIPGLNGSWFRMVYKAPDGMLWASNRSGDLVRYSGQGFQRPDGWPREATNNEVHAMLPHPSGGFWLATDGGLQRLDENEQIRDVTLEGLSEAATWTLLEDPSHGLWLGTARGLFLLSGEPLVATGYLTGHFVEDLAIDRHGQLWAATQEGLLLLDPEEPATPLPLPGELASLASVQAFSLLEDRSGLLWVGTDTGLFRLRQEPADESFVLDHYPSPEILPDRHIKALYESSLGDLWIGARYGGVTRFRPRHVEPLGRLEGLIHDLVWSVMEDREGSIWIATDGGLGRLASDGALEHFTTADGLPANDIGALFQDRSGTLWLGTFGEGLVSRRDGTFRVFSSHPLLKARIRCLYEDRQQRLWVGTDAGLLRRDTNGDHAFGTSDGLQHETTRGVFQDEEGTVWVVTLGGLARYREGEEPAFEPVASPFPGRPKTLFGDPDGTLWIGTWDDGLVRYRDGRFTSIRVEDGLFDRRIHRVLDDRRGGLWMSSNRGVFRVQRTELEAFAEGRIDQVTSAVLDEADGMRSSECNGASHPAGWRSHDGRIWFPTLRGVVAIDPRALEAHEFTLQPVIETLLVDQVEHPLAPRAILPPRSKTVAFRYTAPSFIRAAETRFRYRLVGFDQDWIDAGNERLVQYTNLPPGNYVFEVVARSGGGDWSPEAARLELELAAAFTQTPLFFALCVLMTVVGAWGLYRLRLHRLLTTNRELERIRRELEAKNVMIRAQNAELEGFTYTVSHDLKNPLFTIEGFLGFLEKDLDRDPERAAANLQRVRAAARKMRRLLDELLELTRIGRSVQPEEAIDLGDLVLEALALVEGQLVEQGTRVVVPPNLPVVWGDRTRLLQVFQNLLSNAVKYMGDQERPMIELAAKRQGDEILCHVRDNGCGIEPTYCERVFQLFEQLDPQHEGTGVGLAIVQRVIELHRGKIWVESEGPGQGSTFFFTLPAIPSPQEST